MQGFHQGVRKLLHDHYFKQYFSSDYILSFLLNSSISWDAGHLRRFLYLLLNKIRFFITFAKTNVFIVKVLDLHPWTAKRHMWWHATKLMRWWSLNIQKLFHLAYSNKNNMCKDKNDLFVLCFSKNALEALCIQHIQVL